MEISPVDVADGVKRSVEEGGSAAGFGGGAGTVKESRRRRHGGISIAHHAKIIRR